MNRLSKASLPLALILAAAGLLALGLGATEAGRSVELKALDWRFRHLSRPERADKDIVLVMIDQRSLDHFEKDGIYWPWPRTLYAALTDYAAKGGAKAIVFDVLFTSPSPYGAAEDDELGKALKASGRAVLAFETGTAPHELRPAAAPERFALAGGAPGEARGAARLPVRPVLEGAATIGDTRVEPDLDGVFRRVPLAVSLGGKLYPTLPAAAAMKFSGRTLAELDPILVDGRLPVRFHGNRVYKVLKAGDVLLSWQRSQENIAPEIPASAFKDKLVLVGASAAGLLDNRPSPVSPVYPGTELIAAAADNLLHHDGLPPAGTFALIAWVLLGLGCGRAAAMKGQGLTGAAGALLASAGLAGAAMIAFTKGVWLEMVAPQLALWLGYAAVSAYGYAVEGRQKRYIQGAFSYYLSPEIVNRIAERPETLALGGERREATFYFSDIQGFTSFSEKLDPETLTKLMNRYLGEMTDTVLLSGGTLDKYIGDAVMAFWGAPLPREDHALVACKVALENQRRLAALREEFEKLGYPPVRNRIGLNSGQASIGNMGSPKRFSYTAIGDNVNLASRLEGANKAYGTYILISESTREGAGAAVETRELDYVKVIGKNLPIRVYELLGLAGETDPALVAQARRFEEGLALYRARRFDEAEKIFETGDDYASKKYVARCKDARENPPPSDWDGSHSLTEK